MSARYANRLFTAVKRSILSVICPSARSSCATTMTTAGEVAVPIAAAAAASSGRKPK
ncbi:hypothetical protein D3C83_21250 [compost metagenome]